MIPDISEALSWLEKHPLAVKGIQRGIERETLRVTENGHLATTGHPEILGSALAHPWITTDFAEALLEFITPVDKDVDHLLTFLRDIHRHVSRQLGDERMWPLSMPCFIDSEQNIELAQYGSSNVGRFKTLYREGLKNRYGALMQTISGVHYNFSLPLSFWQAREGVADVESGKKAISAGYFRLIRNYYRFGWVIPYLFGASPAICSSFLKGRETALPFERTEKGMLYLPYATSLRLSDLGYTNKSQSNLGITFNDLDTYVAALKRAIKTPSDEYAQVGMMKDGRYLQLNTNVLQIENELYAPIRPKRVTRAGETPSDALLRGGIEYIEVRSLDINPFSPTGVSESQVRFLDLFLIWCALADAPEMSADELLCTRKNWNRVILEGRKPGQTVGMRCETIQQPIAEVGKSLFADLRRVAEVLDAENDQPHYQQVCDELLVGFDDPETTFSGRLLALMKQEGNGSVGLNLAEEYRKMLSSEPLQVLTEEQLAAASEKSWQRQRQIESEDTMSFADYLAAN
ncbi:MULTISPECIES: glutamate--cysteine ligase [Pectobacterium]|uniref:Glutamate--cysteine ligase n=1 Tax=Pectobacterium punjabense TaxID=2108399 RepID=A0ABX6L519_9GAMM|nr:MULTISPECIES: glutamate--cysteine ligase [Pectobacterium]GKW13424.1 glutamate--cysteine ligase [Pectobacterium carotovorum subsp. carotovorum]MBS4431424.1 glutamate--cysteine ligase [Pectobacterium punjabense]MCE9730672.1 glutamate--cysteine ligase [Pectobacterium sp. IFB5596]PTA64400.1 glutamate--cysteine ligase [Pectobacterium punjabense]QJA21369.1 glutamate--cysteine ligase [Pectobacterium punjabense]